MKKLIEIQRLKDRLTTANGQKSTESSTTTTTTTTATTTSTSTTATNTTTTSMEAVESSLKKLTMSKDFSGKRLYYLRIAF